MSTVINHSTLEDEPSKDWTIEQLMQFCLQVAKRNTDSIYDEVVQNLEKVMQEEIDEVWAAYHKSNENNDNDENAKPNIDLSKKPTIDMKIPSEPAAQQLPPNQNEKAALRIDITSGPYTGKVFFLKPTSRAASLIGRSTSRKYVQTGISLKNDGEVSTSHGKIEKFDGNYYYTDVGSTNGTKIKDAGVEIKPYEKILLPPDEVTELVLGASILQITVLDRKNV